jgi:ubiquinol-cytochrome c reductase cytochrome c subunit
MKGICLLVLNLFALNAPAQTRVPDVANGKQLFLTTGCYQCHGTVGQGGQAGPRLAQTPLKLPGFIAFVRNPAPGNMPPYRAAVLSDAELANIFSYIQTFPPPPPVSGNRLLAD